MSNQQGVNVEAQLESIKGLVQQAHEGLRVEDPLLTITALRGVELAVRALLAETADQAHKAGHSWKAIGEAAGFSQQNATNRWSSTPATD